MMPFFSVIIPTFNRQKTIIRSVSSVLNQKYSSFELIVIDDGSTDNTKKLLKGLNLTYIYKNNEGVSSARNLGIKNAKADWICFLDSDDEWLPEKLDIFHKSITLNNSFKFFHSNEIWIRNNIRVNAPKKFDKSNSNIFARSLNTCIISPSTSCIHIDLLNKYEGFDESLLCCEDYDLWLKIMLEYEVYFVEEYLTQKYGGHADQLSTSFIAMDYFKVKSLNNILLSYKPDIEQKDFMIKALLKKSKQLLSGYIKHNNLKNHDEVIKIDTIWRKS
jgi:glycosyltransferase involved in cell wall biosynthesis